MATPMDQAPTRLISAAGMGDTSRMLGMTITCKASSTDTQGAFALVEYTAAPHFRGQAPHCHVHTTEVFYLLDGMLAFTLGDETIMATQGTSILVPPQVVHAFWNPTAAPVTFLALFSPGGLERYFAELAALVAAEPVLQPADLRKVAALTAKFDVVYPANL